MPDETIKATFLVTPSAKYRLASLKARLRREGIVESESSLVERLLAPASLKALEEQLNLSKAQKTSR